MIQSQIFGHQFGCQINPILGPICVSFRSCECQQVPPNLVFVVVHPNSWVRPPSPSRGAKTHRSGAVADCLLALRALSGTARLVRALKGVVTKTAPRPSTSKLRSSLCLLAARSFILRSLERLRPSRSLPPEQIKNASIFHNSPLPKSIVG